MTFDQSSIWCNNAPAVSHSYKDTHTYTLLSLLIYPVIWSLALWSPQSSNPMSRSSRGWLDDLTYSQPALARDDSRLEALCLLLLAGMRPHKGVMSAGYLSPVPLCTLSECLSKVVHGDCFFLFVLHVKAALWVQAFHIILPHRWSNLLFTPNPSGASSRFDRVAW